MQAIRGIKAAIDLYESSIVPLLLSKCAIRLKIDKKGQAELPQRPFWEGPSKPLSRPTGPQTLGLLGLKFCVWQEKVLLALAIRQQ